MQQPGAAKKKPRVRLNTYGTLTTHLLSWSLGEPLRAFVKALSSLVEAAPSSDVTDWQGGGAAVHMVVAASGLRQRAAAHGHAVAPPFVDAAACASCNM